jgi:hypothetical protein
MSIVEIDRTDYPSIGPRVTPEAIEANIASEHYFTAGDGVMGSIEHPAPEAIEYPEALNLLTICVLVLQNGFTVTGESACADPRNFDAEIGKRVARQNAINKIWPLMGFELRTRLMKMPTNELGEALTRMTAHRLGNPEAFRSEDAEAILSHFNGSALNENGAG